MPHRAGFPEHQGAVTHQRQHQDFKKRCRCCFLVVCCVTAIAVGIALAVTFTLQHFLLKINNSYNQYTSNDTRIVNYSTVLCQYIEARAYADVGVSSSSSATFYILEEIPPLDDHDNLTFSQQEYLSGYGDYHYWSYYLYPGSNFHVSVKLCSVNKENEWEDFEVYFCLIRGKENFTQWKDYPDFSDSYCLYSEYVDRFCHDRYNYSYSVNAEGEYYIVIVDSGYSSIHVYADFDFHRTKYTLDPSNIINQCMMYSEYDSCNVGIPMGSNVGLVSVDPFSNLNGHFSLDFYCGANYLFYGGVFVATAVVVILIIVSIITASYCILRHKKKQYTPLSGIDSARTHSPPPPYVYSPPSYGSTPRDHPTGLN